MPQRRRGLVKLPNPPITPPPPSGDVYELPADRSTLWSAAQRGQIPSRTTIYTTLTPLGGLQDDQPQIQAAVNACPVGQTVKLNGGTFRLNTFVLINKGITLRGAGRTSTLLYKPNGSVYGQNNSFPQDVAPLVIMGPARFGSHDDSTSVNLTVSGAKGAYSVTVSSGAGFVAGTYVLLDRNDYDDSTFQTLPPRNGVTNTFTQYMNELIVWKRHNPTMQFIDDPFPDSLSWYSRYKRPVSEVKKVASVAGNVITFTTPLHIAYPTTKQAQLTRYTQYAHIVGAGVEDLACQGGSDGSIRFLTAAESWVKNVEMYHWVGESVHCSESYQCKVLDSYIHDASYSSPCGGAYAVSWASGSAECLLENNIICFANKVMVERCAGAGCVVAYNHTDNGFIIYALNFCEVGINGSHLVGCHHTLYEGNYSFNYDADQTHGGAVYHTAFRNWLVGPRSFTSGFGPSNASDRCVGLNFGSWYHSIVGNVLGRSGQMAGWQYLNNGTTWANPNDPFGINSPSPGDIFKLGYMSGEWEQSADPKCQSTSALPLPLTGGGGSGYPTSADDGSGTDYYVSQSGNDSNLGTIGSPFATISKGVSVLSPDDNLYIRGGTTAVPAVYTGALNVIDSQTFTVPSGTSASHRITIAPYLDEVVVIQPPFNTAAIRLATGAPHYLRFRDFVVDAVNNTLGAVGADGIYVSSGAHHNQFVRLDVKNGGGNGVQFSTSNGDSPFNELLACALHDNGQATGTNRGYGAYIFTSDTLVKGCDIYSNGGYGLHFYDQPPAAKTVNRNVVCYNRIRNNGTHGGVNYGMVFAWGADNVAYNNLIYGNRGGILAYSGSSNTQIYNNTIYNNTPQGGIDLQYYDSAPVVRNNIVYLNATGITDYGGGTGTPVVDHDLQSDPSFTNASIADFTLQSISAAINVGATIGLVADDFRVLGRPVGAAYEMGALEYEPAGGVGTTLLVANWDWLTSTQSDTAPLSGLPLPDSMYLTQAPSFFAGLTWPWVEPRTGTTYTLPASALYATYPPHGPIGYT